MTNGYTHDLLQYDIRSYYSCGGTTAAADDDYITVFGDGGIVPKVSAQTGEWAFTSSQPQQYGHIAYPNPFNPATTISYQLVDNARVALVVFDIRGRLIRTLVDGERPAGYHSVIWQGTDSAGRKVASGLYFYRMIAQPLKGGSTFHATGKLLFAK